MLSMRSAEVLWWCLTTSGTFAALIRSECRSLTYDRLLDKIAKDIMVCENKTVHRWNGSIGDYKKHLRKKMVSMGAV